MPAVDLPTSFEDQKMESLRKRVKDHHIAVGLQTKEKFQEVLSELFFLQNGGNMMDFLGWKRKPPASYFEYVKTQPLEVPTPIVEDAPLYITPITSESPGIKLPVSTITAVTSTPAKPLQPTATLSKSIVGASLPVFLRAPSTPQVGRPPTTVMTPEQIVEKAKQEAHVVQRIAELQREGLWSEKRLPKVAEPPRAKSHWDYLLEEMVWLAADFAQERKWKKNSARKCGRMVLKHFQDKAAAAAKAEKEEEQRLRKVASFVAKEIRTFWSNVEKLVEYKQQIRLEEKRKRVLDQHLNFIVNETEKYSSLLTEGLKPTTESANNIVEKLRESDDEFDPDDATSTDDEETIAQEETLDSGDAAKNKDREKEEIDALKRESEIPLEDLLDDLPPEYFENLGKPDADADKADEEKLSDDEFEINSDDSEEDDEETIDQAEKEEVESRADELLELEAEKDMPIEKLLAKYSGSPNLDSLDNEEMEEEEKTEDLGDSEGLSSASDSEIEFEDDSKDNMEVDHNVKESLGIESLLDDSIGGQDVATSKLSDAAALAESFQPKGNTLESTKVIAKVPFLLKHSLREYQHIGLDWMAAMYERKLNGILADEMGLGKTIQTIGLLAWLACEKGIWGPHLVVVPTSVMLNWEMEFKKWCPSFKILTYYGSQKDRRQKRMGWTKPNAFHVCITSYKLVIQDHQAFRRKRWRYFILDEAQNIKNFKSQRWQLLLNFQSQRRLLLTGTPLQNNLMELWSLMHFLMPDIFGSHRDFREWFSNPVSGMIEGNAEYNESIIRRLHKVLRPFILRRLKSEVEKQMPQKYEHVVMCRLSKRQRYLYDDFMSKAKTKETLSTGNLLSVINVLMQLRKVCNHPNLFEPRPIVSPFQMESIVYYTASPVYGLLDYNPFEHINLHTLNLMLLDLEFTMTAYTAHRIRKFQVPAKLIEEIDRAPPLPPLCPRGKLRLHVTTNRQPQQGPGAGRGITVTRPSPAVGVVSRPGTNSILGNAGGLASPQQPRLGAPAPLLSSNAAAAATSGALTRPPLQLHLAQQSGTMNAVSVPVASASPSDVPLKESVNEKLALSGDGRLNLSSSVAQQLLNVAANQNDSSTNAGLRTNLRNLIAVSSSSSVVNLNSNAPSPPPVSSQPRTSHNGPEHPTGTKRSSKWNYDRSLFKNNPVDEKKRQERRERLTFLAKLNKIKCEASPIWGSDVIIAVTTTSPSRSSVAYGEDDKKSSEELPWSRRGESYLQCLRAIEPLVGRRKYESLWSETNAIRQLLHTPEQYIDELKDIIQRFVVYTPAVTAPPIVFHASHPPPSNLWGCQKRDYDLKSNLSPLTSILHPIQSAMMTQFPDPRLIQYDCGKLQTLDNLLRHLKVGKHRVLIFTQMTRMLDVLESFLNHHGHIYLRLDGTTRVDQRQVLMERFNADRRIFCFILSTRSGGVGVNLTGADTVIFYDSDWNPTMDAQAQDRCHRIGQTRDVHIYRLISERTVEENILKKANQKRLLGDIAIEGGNFTAATFKKQTIHDLFEVDANEADASKRMAEVLDRPKGEQIDPSASATSCGNHSPDGVGPVAPNKAALGILESALAAAEDETDVAAARIVRAEAAAEMAEFDESAPLASEDGENNIVDAEINKAEVELQQLEEQLTPVERYALKYMESSEECWSAEQLRAAEAQIEEQKRAWELKRLATLSGNDDERGRLNDSIGGVSLENDGGLLTYAHQDSVNQKWISMDGLEEMPIWCPPTPPQDDSDVYMDYTLGHLYETRIMDEASLPPVYVRKELKRPRKESVQAPPDDGRRPAKVRKEETVYAPRSLFDRPSPALAKLRRDLKLQKFRGIVRPPIPHPNLTLKTPALPIRPMEENENTPEWLVHEDWILLQAVQNLLELPLNLVILTPAHTPNWDLVADMVNSYSRSYRSPKQCRNRYIHVILPREEGKAAIDTSPKKIKKTKSLQPPIPTKTGNRQMRTSQLVTSDNNNTFTTVWHQKFETLKSIFHKKAPTNRSMLTSSGASANRSATNAKHAQVLLEAGIAYDTPLNPVQVAAVRAERIAQKQKAAVAMAEQVQVQQQQQRLANLASSASPAVSGTPGAPSSPATAARVTSTASPSTLAANPMAGAATASTQMGSTVVMNTISSASSTNTQHTLLLQGSGGANIQGSAVQQQVVLQSATGIRTQRPLGTLTVQEVVAGASPVRTQQQAGTIVSGSPAAGQTVVTVGNLAAVQAAAHMLASAGIAVSGAGVLNTVTTTAAGVNKGASVTVVQTGGTTVVSPATGTTKTLTPTQIQYLRQQALVKQQQQRLQDQQLKKLQLVTVGGTGAAGGASSQLTATGVTTTGQKVPLVGTVSTSLAGTASALSSLNTVQIAGQPQAGARTQLLKGNATTAALLGKGGTVARAIVTDSEMAALLKRQQQIQQQQQQKAAAAAAANAGSSGLQSNLGQQQTVQIGTGANSTGITTAQFLAQAGLQVQTAPAAGGQPQVATLVKTVSTPGSIGGAPSVTIPVSAISVGLPQMQVKGLTAAGVKAGTATQQQLRQFTIQHQLLHQRKTQQQQPTKTSQLAQTVTLGTVKGVPGQQLATAVGTVQLVQPVGANTAAGGATAGGATAVSKPGAMSTTVTMQQLQQVIRQVTAGNAQVLVSSPSSGAGVGGTGMFTKNQQGQTVQARVIPVTQQGLKQTIQVVTTGQPGSAGGTTRVATLSASATGGTMAPSLASALAAGTWKVAGGTDAQQKALLSQVSAALQSGQPVSLAVRAGPNASGQTRILTTGTTFSTMTVTSVVAAPITATTPATTITTPSTTTATIVPHPTVVAAVAPAVGATATTLVSDLETLPAADPNSS